MQRFSSASVLVVIFVLVAASPADASGISPQPILADIFDDMFKELADAMREASTWLLQQVLYIIQSSPQPEFLGSNGWYQEQYGTMGRIAILLVVPFAILATIQAILKGGISEVMKVYLIGVPIATLGAFVAIAMVSLLLEIDNDMSNALLGRLYEDYQGYLENVTNAPTAEDVGYLLLQIIVLGFMALGTLLVFVELIFRTIALYMSVLFLPLAFAAYIWQPSRSFYSKLATITISLVFSKTVIVAVLTMAFAAIRFAFGDGALDGADETRSHIGALLAGVVAFFFAAVSVPALLALVVGQDAVPAGGDLTRKQVGAKSPFGADTRFTGAAYRDALTFGQYKKFRGN